MPLGELYRKQAELLISILPHVAKENCFALKGGTAINFFVRNLPRLSVDIDLTWVPLTDRNQSLTGIEDALRRIAKSVCQADKSIRVTESAPGSQTEITKIVLSTRNNTRVKIEVTPVLRGCVFEPVIMSVSQRVEEEFGFAETRVLSFADLYAGKIAAALDRQHPRDLFDVHYLFNNEGITDELRAAIVIYLISNSRWPHSLLKPTLRDISQDFEQNFIGMAVEEIALETLLQAREQLIHDVVNNMPQLHKEFLLSFYNRKPKWELLELGDADKLPAVKWKELNLDRAEPNVREGILRNLESVIYA